MLCEYKKVEDKEDESKFCEEMEETIVIKKLVNLLFNIGSKNVFATTYGYLCSLDIKDICRIPEKDSKDTGIIIDLSGENPCVVFRVIKKSKSSLKMTYFEKDVYLIMGYCVQNKISYKFEAIKGDEDDFCDEYNIFSN